MTKLSVNIDHVATLRQARGTSYPDPVEVAAIAEKNGAHGITAHLRIDRRHLQDDDLYALRERVLGKLNLEMSVAPEMISLALEIRPDQVTLVPERAGEITTEGGLDLLSNEAEIQLAAERLAEAGLPVSLFLDPETEQIERAATWGDTIRGFEINTDRYTRLESEAVEDELARIAGAAQRGSGLGLAVYAGHGLTTANVRPIAAIGEIAELNIGHFLISRSVSVGIKGAVREMLDAMAS